MLSFDGNTAPYLQYAHTRVCSLFRRAEVDRADVRSIVPTVEADAERALAIHLLGYEHRRRRVGRAVRSRIGCARTSTSWPSDFTTFYEHCPVLARRRPDPGDSRLALCDVTARVLAHGLGLLGIDAPEQM